MTRGLKNTPGPDLRKNREKKSLLDRMEGKYEVTSLGCWMWTASKHEGGYGSLFDGKRLYKAHQVSYWLYHGAPPPGTEIDHLCGNRACVNPGHLEAVTHTQNARRRMLRAVGWVALAGVAC